MSVLAQTKLKLYMFVQYTQTLFFFSENKETFKLKATKSHRKSSKNTPLNFFVEISFNNLTKRSKLKHFLYFFLKNTLINYFTVYPRVLKAKKRQICKTETKKKKFQDAASNFLGIVNKTSIMLDSNTTSILHSLLPFQKVMLSCAHGSTQSWE